MLLLLFQLNLATQGSTAAVSPSGLSYMGTGLTKAAQPSGLSPMG